MKESPTIKRYFEAIQHELNGMYDVADAARKKGFDPEDRVDIPLAKNMAERVEGLISAVAPQIINSGVSERIQELEKQYKPLAWEVALTIAAEVAAEKFCKFKDKKEAMEVGIRSGFAYHTIGVVSAPLEGFTELRFKTRRDGKEYLAACFSGPIRGAGGTAAAFCLMIVDFIRIQMGYSPYDPDENEINRYVTELYDYHERVTNLQYKPSPEEISYLIRHIPIEIDGDPTEEIEVSNYKDLPRVSTDRIRGGVCLVASMAALKAPKLWKEIDRMKGFGMDWNFLKDFLVIQKSMKAAGGKKDKVSKLSPDFTFISDLVAGRPVLTFPLAKGGFRLRYGRTRMSGYSAAAISPLTMAVLENYIATGTQLKVERPGKAAAIGPCDTIEGPIVKLKNGNVIRLESLAEAKQLTNEVEEIIYLGDFLVSYGDFFDRAHPLVPAGYCEEWYAQELEAGISAMYGSVDLAKLHELTGLPAEALEFMIKNPLITIPAAETSLLLSEKLSIPLHPRFTYHWAEISMEDLKELITWMQNATVDRHEGKILKIILPIAGPKRALEILGIPHSVATKTYVVIEGDDAIILERLLISGNMESFAEIERFENAIEAVSSISGIKLRDKDGTFIGARMGRPEKAKMRKLTGSPHGLFPVGDEGGRLRSMQSALEKGKVRSEFPLMHCPSCNKGTIYSRCETCSSKTVQRYYCRDCGDLTAAECKHGPAKRSKDQDIDIKHYYELAIKKTKIAPNLVKGVRGTMSRDHIPEHMMKAVLRAKYAIAVNKDGTTRYDITEVPITHFKPKEIGTSVEKLIDMGYEKDIEGKPLTDENQIIELFPQDMILPSNPEAVDESSDEVLFRVAQFIDELLVLLYDAEPYYKLESKKDLVGQLVIGLAPHISAGMVGRIIGFSKTLCFLAHPLYHAAMRRDADGDEACVMLAMDALLNFSRQYLPDSRGGRTMDAPLVLTSKLVPAEVDDMAHRLDVAWKYPLALYEAALQYKTPDEVKIELLGSRLNTPAQYEGLGYTHTLSNINMGVVCSAYKTLPSMEDKLKGQMIIAEKIRAVETSDVARLVIEKHFIKDIKGNLRKFSTQQFRCIACNKKFRRPLLIGKCDACGGRIIFTVSEGAVIKYTELAKNLAIKYNVPAYVQQTLMITQRRIDEVFGKDSERQVNLNSWFAQ